MTDLLTDWRTTRLASLEGLSCTTWSHARTLFRRCRVDTEAEAEARVDTAQVEKE